VAGSVTDVSPVGGREVLLIRTPPTHVEERRYVLDVVLCEWLGMDYELGFGDEPGFAIRLAGDPQMRELMLPDLLFATSPADWLTPRSMPVPPLARPGASLAGVAASSGTLGLGRIDRPMVPLPVLFGAPTAEGRTWRWTAGGVALDLDVFGSVFYLLTRYEEIARPVSDRHGRFPASASLAATEGFVDRPIVDDYVDLLWMAIHSLWPGLQRPTSIFRLRLTHDVDAAWATYGLRAGAIAHALAGDVFNRRDLELAARRLRSVFDSRAGRVDRDPFNTFNFLMDISERHGLASTFYFMAGVSAPEFDGEYRLSDPRVGGLLRRIHDRGHDVGLHASYGTHLSAERMRTEFDALRLACNLAGFDQGTWGVRQHYLRFENPQTWRSQESAGLDHDSTLGFADRIGFRAGTSREFPVFDLLTSRTLKLRERPLVVMDGTLFEYMGLGLDEAASQTRAIVDSCRLHGGDAVLLYHNHTVAGARPAAHYRDLVERLVVDPGLSR